MASLETLHADPLDDDAWSWWEGHRLRYNLVLAAAGWLAYAMAVIQAFALGRSMWASFGGAVSTTLFLGLTYLVAMGLANVAYLLGPTIEGWVRPAGVAGYRRAAFAVGLGVSCALAFALPLLRLADLLGYRV